MNSCAIELSQKLEEVVEIKLACSLPFPLILFQDFLDNRKDWAVIRHVFGVKGLYRLSIVFEHFQDRLCIQDTPERLVLSIK